MPDEFQIYQSDLTGPELDEALRNIGKVQQSVADAAQSAATAEQYGAIVQKNQQAIQEIHDNLTVIKAAPGNAQAAQTAATQAAASATQAAGSAADAAQSAEDAQAAAQQALGFRTFFDAISPDTDGSLDPSRPMTTTNAKSSWTVKSTGDMLRSVEVLGYTSGGAGAGADGHVTVTVQGHTTKTADLPLTAQLLAGESVQSYVDSGCDAYIEYDGSADEVWGQASLGDFGCRYWILISAKPSDKSENRNPAFSNWLPITEKAATYSGVRGFSIATDGKLYIYTDGSTLAAFKAALAENPLKLWYTAATPTGEKHYVSLEKHKDGVTYSHAPVEIDADPYIDGDSGEAGTYTIRSDTNTSVRVTLEPLRTDAYSKDDADARFATVQQVQQAQSTAEAAQTAASTAQSAASSAQAAAGAAQSAAAAATSKVYTATLTVQGWAEMDGGGYEQTVSCAGMTADVVPQPPAVQTTGTAATDLASLQALACIQAVQTLSGQIRALCYEGKPTVDLTIYLTEVH